MRTVGRYALHDEIASGGMGTVHLGRLLGEGGFSRPVAIKRLHPHLARQEEFVHMFMDEARLAARIRHPNVLPTVDVVREDEELFLVMEYVHGAPLSLLLAKMRESGRRVPLRIASAIANGLLLGLHAAHEATDEKGHALGIVHRDVSPQNVLVGSDGSTRVLDFGVAKARGRLQASTGEGTLKGKLGYLAPEQIRGSDVGRSTDIYAAAVVIWELITGRRLFPGENEGHVLEQILVGYADPPSKWDPSIPEELDQTILQGLHSDPERRFKSAREMAMAIERSVPAAPAMEVGEWVERTAFDLLEGRAKVISAIEHGQSGSQSKIAIDEITASKKRKEDPSSISVARTMQQPNRRRAFWALLALVPLLFLLIYFVRKPSDEPRAVATPASAAPPPSPSPVVELPTVIATEEPAPSPTHSKPKSIVKPKAAPSPSAKPAPSPTTNADCTPPYTWDALGRRIYKRHCLHLAPQ
jgi:eukaryotic-like serine/threonine-protein kinase